MHMRASEIASWLRERVAQAGARGLVVGLTGTLNSAVVAGLCHMALPGQVAAVLLPCHDEPRDETDARLAAAHFGIACPLLDIAPAYDRLVIDAERAGLLAGQADAHEGRAVAGPASFALANLKARLRMTSLYLAADGLGYLVAGTANRCDLTIGAFTKYGDGAVDLLPLGGLLESDIIAIARDLGLPAILLERPAAVPLAARPDVDDPGFSRKELERYLTDGPDGVPPALALRVERMMRGAAHKRTPPPIPGEPSTFD
jgi:NAD+ synthase